MRIIGRLAACGLVAGMIVAGAVAAPAARAADTPAGETRAADTPPPSARVASARLATARVARAQAAAAGLAGVKARWAELANAATGADLWSRSSVSERPMGSVTKVMTAYVVIKAGDLNRVITVPASVTAYDKKYDASTAGLKPGEKLTAAQLLYAMMLPSGCDAAYTLAVAYGPGFSGFVAKMNATARKLGLKKTRFTDPAGLPDPTEYSNYSTAHDLVILGIDAMKVPLFAAVVGTGTYRLAAGHGHLAHAWKNLDPLLGKYSGAIGIKTGFTDAAGQCLLFEARRGSRTLIGVVLHSSSDGSDIHAAASDAAGMLNWGFSR